MAKVVAERPEYTRRCCRRRWRRWAGLEASQGAGRGAPPGLRADAERDGAAQGRPRHDERDVPAPVRRRTRRRCRRRRSWRPCLASGRATTTGARSLPSSSRARRTCRSGGFSGSTDVVRADQRRARAHRRAHGRDRGRRDAHELPVPDAGRALRVPARPGRARQRARRAGLGRSGCSVVRESPRRRGRPGASRARPRRPPRRDGRSSRGASRRRGQTLRCNARADPYVKNDGFLVLGRGCSTDDRRRRERLGEYRDDLDRRARRGAIGIGGIGARPRGR